MRRLIIRPGGIGDCILALPAMQSLKADYTEVWVPTSVVPLIHFADRVRPLSSTGIELIGIPDRQVITPSLEGFDHIVSWYGTAHEEFRDALRTLPVQFLAALPPPNSPMHAADFFAAQVGAPTPAFPRIAVPGSSAGDILIHPFSGGRRKNWPLDRFQSLAELLPAPVRFCAGPEEALPGALRLDNLHELATYLVGARLYLGNDSGITHLAAAAGTKVVALFGPTDPLIWAPRGPNVTIIHGELQSITVDRVRHAISTLL